MEIGYFLSSEEFGPHDMVEQARRALASCGSLGRGSGRYCPRDVWAREKQRA